jgi:hypothetical protein
LGLTHPWNNYRSALYGDFNGKQLKTQKQKAMEYGVWLVDWLGKKGKVLYLFIIYNTIFRIDLFLTCLL